MKLVVSDISYERDTGFFFFFSQFLLNTSCDRAHQFLLLEELEEGGRGCILVSYY